MYFNVYSNFHIVQKIGYIGHIDGWFIFVDYIHVGFESGRKIEFFVTKVACKFFVPFVHNSKVDFQAHFSFECLATKFTFQLIFSFVTGQTQGIVKFVGQLLGSNKSLVQILGKWYTILPSMNFDSVVFTIAPWSKLFLTISAFVLFHHFVN